MNKRAIVLILVGLLCLTSIAFAQVSETYDLSWHVIGGGGGQMDSASYAMRSTAGQIIGLSSSDNYQLGAGYWYSVEEYKPKKCGDVAPYPSGDGVVNMEDVMRLLNHVGNPGKFPVYEWSGDCKCDGGINMGDVVLLLNHVDNPDEFPLECC
ncbi:MAG: hypothetical protein KAT65_19225 [Methanophagales archaeon]|nr:hypothetical protein [Methanophagales archaeon]